MINSPLFTLDFPGDAVVTDDGRVVSYAELKRLTEAWHPEIQPRSLVFLLVHNNLDSLVAYVACLNRGIVPLMLDAKIDAELLVRFKATYRPSYILNCVTSECTVPQNSEPETQNSKPETQNSKPETFLHPDLALLITTSGSTGAPKLVRQSYRNIQANAESIAEYLKIDATERPITTLPMNYVYGLSIINSHLIRGATILLTDKTLMQREFWNFFNEQKATSFGGVPYTYEMLDKLMFFRRKLPSLRTMTQAGGKILPELHQKFAEYAQREGKNFVVMYGASEATSRMSYLPPERALDKVGSMGIAIPCGRFMLVDADGNLISDHQSNTRTLEHSNNSSSNNLSYTPVGELVYEGPNVTLGYAECAEDLSKGDERHGRLETGDMAKRDSEGFYYIVGRKKRFLKIFGNRVNLDETERLIKGHFTGIDCACGGVDDKMKIYVEKSASGSEFRVSGSEEGVSGSGEDVLENVRQFVAEKTHLNFTAFEVCWIGKIPKNDSGKTLYAQLP